MSRIHLVAAAKPQVTPSPVPLDRDEAIAAIRAALKTRTKTKFSVTGGRGTSWGWIGIDATPATFKLGGKAVDAVRKELNQLMGLTNVTSPVSIPASSAHRREYLERAQGKTPSKIAEPYWD